MGKQDSELKFAHNNSPSFEINVLLKSHTGDPLVDGHGNFKTKNYKTNSGYKLWEFYQRYQGKPKRKKKRVDPKNLPKKEEATKLAAQAAVYAEKRQQTRDK